jgi:hypothetical protein
MSVIADVFSKKTKIILENNSLLTKMPAACPHLLVGACAAISSKLTYPVWQPPLNR